MPSSLWLPRLPLIGRRIWTLFFRMCQTWRCGSRTRLTSTPRFSFSLCHLDVFFPCHKFSRLLPVFLNAKRRGTISSFLSATMTIPSNGHASERKSLSEVAPLQAVLFDIDGTLCDSDPIHYYAFRELLAEVGYNNGVPITEDDFVELISGKHNDDIGKALFPAWDSEKSTEFLDKKEAMFRRLIPQQLKAVAGLYQVCKWVKDRNLLTAAVTNAPRLNAELMISILGLTDFFHVVVVGSECARAKPFPDPYLKALKELNASFEHTFVFEDSVSGIKAGVDAGMPVVGVTTRNPTNLLMDAGASLLIKDYEDPKLWAALEELDKGPIVNA